MGESQKLLQAAETLSKGARERLEARVAALDSQQVGEWQARRGTGAATSKPKNEDGALSVPHVSHAMPSASSHTGWVLWP